MKKMVIVILIIVSLFLMVDLIERNQFDNFFYSKRDIREEFIIQLKNEEIEKDKSGKLILRDKYSKLAQNNRIDVYVCDEKECVVSFLYKGGIPDEDQYLFYSSTDENLIKKYVADYLYSRIKKIDKNWYFVQFN